MLVEGVIKRLVPVFGSQAGFRSRFSSLPTAFPVTGKHLFVKDPVILFQRCEFGEKCSQKVLTRDLCIPKCWINESY